MSCFFSSRAPRFVGLLAVCLALAGGAHAQAPAAPVFDRVSECGQSPSSSVFLVEKIAVDAAGNVYAAGYFAGVALFGSTLLTSAGGTDWWVARLDAAGAVAWAVRGGGPGDDRPYGLALDGQGHVFVGGEAQGQATFGPLALGNNPLADPVVAVARLDAAGGAWQWLAQGGDDRNNECRGLAVDGRGHVYVGGRTGVRGSIATFGGLQLRPRGSGNLFAARLDAGTGAWQWVTLAGSGEGGLSTTALALDGAGGVYVAGRYQTYPAAVPFGPGVSLPPAVTGFGGDVFVAKLDTAGAWRWVSGGGGPDGADEPQALAADAAGRVVVCGYFRSTAPSFGATVLTNTSGLSQFGTLLEDGFAAGLDAGTGAWRWAVPISGSQTEFCKGAALDGAGDAYLIGFANGQATVGPLTFTPSSVDLFAARLSATTGQWRWALAGGGRGDKAGSALALGSGGSLYVCGSSVGATQTDFGPVALAGAPGLWQGFVARLAGAAGPLGTRPPVWAGAGLAVWPNPAAVGGRVQVQGLAAGALVQVLDATGREVARLRGVGGAEPLALPAGLAPGLYLLRAGAQTVKLQLE